MTKTRGQLDKELLDIMATGKTKTVMLDVLWWNFKKRNLVNMRNDQMEKLIVLTRTAYADETQKLPRKIN